MKLVMLILLLHLPVGAWAQQPSPSTPATTVPNGNSFQAGLTLADQRRKIDDMKGACDLIFLGDSITAQWDGALWRQFFAPRHALNLGIGGDNIQGLLYRLDYAGLKELQPRVVVILIGTNNGGPAEETAAGIAAVLAKTRSLFPQAKIVLMDILPTARRTDHVQATNHLIAAFSDGQEVIRLNLWDKMLPEGDSWKGLRSDKLHLSPEGYRFWAEALAPLLEQLMGPLTPASAN